jgi:hypothetical protein
VAHDYRIPIMIGFFVAAVLWVPLSLHLAKKSPFDDWWPDYVGGLIVLALLFGAIAWVVPAVVEGRF